MSLIPSTCFGNRDGLIPERGHGEGLSMRTAVSSGLACKGIARGSALSAVLLVLVCFLWSSEAHARRPLDRYVRPQPGGTHLKVFGFIGPGVRTILESYVPIEEDMSELRLQAWGDVNYGYSQISAHADFRFFLLGIGGSVGYRDEWRSLQFERDAKTGRDMGYTALNRELRREKEQSGHASVDGYALAEGRLSLFMPLDPLLGLSIFSVRYEGRANNSFDWETATVYDKGVSYRWETLLPFHYRKAGFIGPAFRLMTVPRTQFSGKRDWETELHYGFVAGTSPDWMDSNDQILVRIYSTYGLNNDYFGTHTFYAPLQIIVGYQADIDF